MDKLTNDLLLVDCRYALRQLQQFGDVQRAVDALERIEANLKAADWHPDDTVEIVVQ